MLLLPLKTDRPRIRPAFLTGSIILVCTVVHVVQALLPVVAVEIRGRPVELPALVADWGLWGSRPTLATLLSHQFIHGDWFHLLGNMLFLWIFGSLLEDVLRPRGFLLLFLGGGVSAAVIHLLITHSAGGALDVPMVGASGAVAAILGLFVLRFHRTQVEFFYWLLFVRGTVWLRAAYTLPLWLLMEVVGGFLSLRAVGGAAHWAHVGGFIAGLMAAPWVDAFSGAQSEFVTDDPATNVRYLAHREKAAAVERALAADPGNAYLMRELARAYRRAGEFERASQTYQRSVWRFVSRGMLEQGAECYLELNDYDAGAVLPADVESALAHHLEAAWPDRAIRLHRDIASRYVGREEAQRSLLRLPVLYSATSGSSRQVLDSLNEFLATYPNSPHAPAAREWRDRLSQPEVTIFA